MVIHKPAKINIPRISVPGIILKIEKNKWFTVGRRYRSRESEELKEVKLKSLRIEKGDDKKYNFFSPTIVNAHVNLLYLNMESAKGLYKDPENNLPYEIVSQYGELIYRHNVKERKEDIFNRLEKLAVEEGLRK